MIVSAETVKHRIQGFTDDAGCEIAPLVEKVNITLELTTSSSTSLTFKRYSKFKNLGNHLLMTAQNKLNS